jgi:hypothetical protein
MPSFSRADYEQLLYSLPERYFHVTSSTLRLYTHSAATAFIRGSIYFDNGLELRVFEYLDLTNGELFDYSYTILRGEERIRWYDPQPHPEDSALSETFPHHYHEAPDIKHHRLPAFGIHFQAPNIDALITDCVKLSEPPPSPQDQDAN